MLIAIYRANQDAFIRENVNLVRAGRILNIPAAEALGSVDVEEANRLVRAHMAEFREYRSRLAAVPAAAEAAPGQRESEPAASSPSPQRRKPAAPARPGPLSKADPQKPGAASQAARGDDATARERALKEAQSRISDLEKNVCRPAEAAGDPQPAAHRAEKKAGVKPAPSARADPRARGESAREACRQRRHRLRRAGRRGARARRESAGSAEARAPSPRRRSPAPAPTPAPAPPTPSPAPEAPPPPAPEPSLIDEFLDNPVAPRRPRRRGRCCCWSTPSGCGEKKRPHTLDFTTA